MALSFTEKKRIRKSFGRIAEAIEQGLDMAGGLVKVFVKDGESESEQSFSEHYFYPDSTVSFPELEPRLFSFNNPFGACPACSGLGTTMEFDPEKIIPDMSLSFNQRALPAYNPADGRGPGVFADSGSRKVRTPRSNGAG
jgi:excinuclease UvrABC ATPase subunit